MNMRLTELLMHKIFVDSLQARTPGLDGYTEWFDVDFLRVKKMQITLFALAAFINFGYFTAATFLVMFLSYLLFWGSHGDLLMLKDCCKYCLPYSLLRKR
jgi:hypothetical protein